MIMSVKFIMTDEDLGNGSALQNEIDGAPLEGDEEETKEVKFENIDEAMLEEVTEVFDIFDKNKDETIEVSAMATVLRWLKFNPTETELAAWTKKYDPHQQGSISLKQIKEIVNKKIVDTDTIDELIEALKLFDGDHDGKIQVSELRWFLTQLGDKMDETQVDEMLKEIDKDSTGFVEILEVSRISFNIKEEKPKEDKKPAKK